MPRAIKFHDQSERHIGWMIYCPACKTHHAFRTEIPMADGSAPWKFNGDAEHPTFTPSMLSRVPDPDRPGRFKIVCHSFVKDGQIRYLNDCTHEFAGKTLMLPDPEAPE